MHQPGHVSAANQTPWEDRLATETSGFAVVRAMPTASRL